MPEITEADRRAADSWAGGIFGQQALPAAFAAHREATEAAIVAWLRAHECSSLGAQEPFDEAADAIDAGAHRS